jgi:hypothetical protein
MVLRRRFLDLIAVITLLVAAILAFGARGGSTSPGGEGRAGGAAELQEQTETTDDRVFSERQARKAGDFGRREQIIAAAAPGFAGEQVMNPATNDWEPAIATDPAAPFVYMLTTRYTKSTDPVCGNRCPLPWIVLRVSSNDGATWGPQRPLCSCARVNGQFDPIIEVVPGTGHVYAVWMNNFDTVFSKSTDHGQTWSTPVKTYGKVSWTDKPVIAMSDNGQDVYVSWNGPQSGDPWVAQSHNAGATWTQTKVVNSGRYFFAYDADVLPNGTIVFSQSSFSYTGPQQSPEGTVNFHTIRSTNQGTTWTTSLVDAVEIGEPCVSEGCYSDFYMGQSAVTADANGNLTILYDGATNAEGPQSIWVRRSTDGGASWSARTSISTPGENATFPAAEARGAGDVRTWYMEENGGPDAWNVWYRSSTDGGLTWTAAVNISDATTGAGYKTASGFLEPYGDYGEVGITSTGKTIGVWSEGFSYNGPGGTWFNRQT